MISYINGNTKVTILKNGTKIREYNDIPKPIHPESIDIKITNYCDLGCSYCHESSTKEGKHANLYKLLEILKSLPEGVELAIGGGNPLSHPDLIYFLKKVSKQGLISNLTINQGHLKQYFNLIKELITNNLIYGIGISITNNNFNYIKKLQELSLNIVFHVIAGINNISILNTLSKLKYMKVLILGYKEFGFAKNIDNTIQDNINDWAMYLVQYINKGILTFDNLAIEQLTLKRLFTNEGWNTFYMGDDFTFTMYIDAINKQYAPTSRSNNRKSFNNYSLIEYFQNDKIT